jgi:hypothetical protein
VDAPVTPRSVPSVVSGHQDSVDSFERGRITREMINASTMSRCRPLEPSSAGTPSWCAIAATAATCPCGRERTMESSAPVGTSDWPFNVASIASMTSAGSFDRFARVSWRTFLPSR